MGRFRKRRLLAGVGVSLLIASIAGWGSQTSFAQNTHVIAAGAESTDQSVQIYDFIPKPVTVNVGDTVTWRVDSTEFHTVTFLSGAPVPPFVAPAEEGLAIDPLAVLPDGNPRYDGTGVRTSGLLVKGQTFSLTFDAPGTFQYVCLVHPHMVADISVKPAGEVANTPSQTEAQIAPHIANDIATRGLPLAITNATELVASGPSGPAAGVTAGAGDQHVALYRFLPGNVTIHSGESVVWTNYDTDTPHTVTFLSGAPEPEVITPMARPEGPPILTVNPLVLLPQGGDIVNGSTFVSSGFIGGEVPVTTYTARFTAPGTYEYICALHDEMGMRGTVTVLP